MLSATGDIIGSSSSNEKLARTSVNLNPIQEFLTPDRILPIKGDDPKHNSEQRIFSAFPVYTENSIAENPTIAGYVYAVVAGEHYQSVLDSIIDSYSFKNLGLTLSGVLLLALLSGLMVFMMLTRRLRSLTSRVSKNAFALTHNDTTDHSAPPVRAKLDEIDQLAYSYQTMANKLVNQFEELENTDTKRREFIANISHDLRTPLTTMQSYLETLLIKNHTLNTEEKHNYLSIAYRQSKHLRSLVSQLFTLTKLESGEVTPFLETFSLLELAHDTVQEFQIKAGKRGVKLSIQPDDNLGGEFDVNADIGMIQRVFENLVGNAIRHTSNGGELMIRLGRSHADYVDIAFMDTGCGMTQEQCTHVMQRYYTAADNTKDIGGQLGLGLAIVNNILTLHNSVMNIESKPDKGTTFGFRLASSMQAAKHYRPTKEKSQMVS